MRTTTAPIKPYTGDLQTLTERVSTGDKSTIQGAIMALIATCSTRSEEVEDTDHTTGEIHDNHSTVQPPIRKTGSSCTGII